MKPRSPLTTVPPSTDRVNCVAPRKLFPLIMIASVLLFAGVAGAATVHVPTDQPTIQAGIDSAQTGDTVVVEPGTYGETGNINLFFNGKAITLASAAGPDSTIIDGGAVYPRTGFNFQDGEDSLTVVDGFTLRHFTEVHGAIICIGSGPTIKNCVIENQGFASTGFYGGAMYCSAGSPRLIDCTFRNNSLGCSACKSAGPIYERGGAAIKCEDSSTLRIVNCLFENNLADIIWSGGAISSENSTLVIDSSSFFGNSSLDGMGCNAENTHGGAIFAIYSDVTISNSQFIDNESCGGGGAVTADSCRSVTFHNCLFESNNAYLGDGMGGALFLGGESVTVSECSFYDNRARLSGGGIHARTAATVEFSSFVGNTASGEFDIEVIFGNGGGLFAEDSISITNCLFNANLINEWDTDSTFLYDTTLGSGIHSIHVAPAIANTIFTDNRHAPPIYYPPDSTPIIVCSNLYGNESGDWTGPIDSLRDTLGNFSADPVFCDPDGNDFTIYDISPCTPWRSPCSALVGAHVVACVDSQPEITSPDSVTVFEDSLLVYHYTFTDPDGPDTIIVIENLPSWLTAESDSIYGIPSMINEDTSFTIIVSDGYKADAMSVTVVVVQTTPEICQVLVDGSTDPSHVVNHSPLFEWDYCPDNIQFPQERFELEIGIDTAWDSAETWDPGILETQDSLVTYDGAPLLDSMTYFYRLRVRNQWSWSSWYEDSLHLNAVPSVPLLLTPDSGAIVDDLPTLWVLNASDFENDSLTYEFYGFHDTDCVSPGDNIDLTGIPAGTDSTGATITDPLADNCYYWWRARAFDGHEYSDWSDYATFLVNAVQQAPQQPVAHFPPGPDDSILFDLKPTFVWSASFDPDPFDTVRFVVTIALDSNFIDTFLHDSLSDTTILLTDSLSLNTPYWWHVVAFDNFPHCVLSETLSFWTWTLADCDRNHQLDISDLIFLVNYMFEEGPPPIPVFVADVTGDCSIDVGDLVYLVDYMFRAGEPLLIGCEP